MRQDSKQPMPYTTGETPMVGDLVRIPDREVDSYKSAVQPKIKGRIGYISGFTYPCAYPLVKYLAIGRKKEFALGQVQTKWLEFISRAEE